MVLASGAHVSIGGIEYMLVEKADALTTSVRGQVYIHQFQSLFASTTAIAGETAKDQLRPEKMLWSWTDWSGGEGFPIYHPEEPNRYDVGTNVNVTQPGLLTTRPQRYRTTVTRAGSSQTGIRPAGGSTWDKAVILWGSDGLFSRDGIGWSVGTGAGTANYQFFDGDSDGRYMVVGVLHEGTTTDILPAADGVTPAYADLFTGTTLLNPPYVSEVLNGVWYAWGIDGANSNVLALVKGAALNTTSAGTLIYNSGVVPNGAWGSSFWTDIESAESSLFMSFGTPAGSLLWRCDNDTAAPYWTSPPGFCIQKLVYQLGVLFCVGAQTSAGKKFASLYAIPLSTGSPIFLGAPRRHRNTELGSWEAACAGPEAKLFLADSDSGKIFVYDMAQEAFSLFDDLTSANDDGTSFVSYANLLPIGMSTFESGDLTTSGWTAETGPFLVAVRNSTAPQQAAHNGTYSVQEASVSLGAWSISTPTGIKGLAVSPSTQYTAGGYVKSSGSANTITAAIRWYNAAGTLLSTSTGTAVNLTTSYQLAFVTATSPSTTAYAALLITKTGTSTVGVFDDAFFVQGSSTTPTARIANMFMHGSRLIVDTWSPGGTGTALQVITYEDLVKENRDDSQRVRASIESGQWDFGVPQEQKALIGFYVTYEVTDPTTVSGLVANSRIQIGYATDNNISVAPTYTDLTAIDSNTTVTQQGRHFIQVSDENLTTAFTRLKMRVILDNTSSAVAPPIVYSVVAEAQLLAYAETWDLIVQVMDEPNNERPSSTVRMPEELRDNLLSLAVNKQIVQFLDGFRYPTNNDYTTHTVIVEDPTDIIDQDAEGYMRVRLRAVPV